MIQGCADRARRREKAALTLADRLGRTQMAAGLGRSSALAQRTEKGTWTMKLAMIALALALGWAVSPAPAEAAGCLKGALVGGVAGQDAGHHAILGAIGGCIVGRHLASEKDKQNAAAAAHGEQTPQAAAPAHNGY
jgi:hypothetical protein